jgi:ribonuclease G
VTEEILINVTPRETRVAVVENGMLQEVHVERALRRGYVGNIYKGRVSRVMPGMQAAFVEIGLERAAFLHASDIVRAMPALLADGAENGNAPIAQPPIGELVREGQEIVVQVVKDPIGSKGARLTTNLSVPSRYLVLLPYVKVIGVSVRIEDEAERARLKEILQGLATEANHGYIVRTNAEGQPREALAEDVAYLGRLWQSLQENLSPASAGKRVYEDLSLPLRALRDLMRKDVEKVRVDSRETFERTVQFAQTFMPDLAERIEHYPGERPIFDLYGVEDEIQRALKKEVPLKSGGYLVIDQTEAMTTIDVNTGAFLGHRNLEETVYKTNLEAAQAAARQLRLRNLGGIIIIDFIDMENLDHRAAVLAELNKALEKDRTRLTVNGFTQLGLVEMTRKRTRESLAHVLCETCPTCGGRGEFKTAQTICYDILREILRESKQFNAREFRILASQSVIDMFLDEESQGLAQLGDFIGKPISLQVETLYTQEQYDIVLI